MTRRAAGPGVSRGYLVVVAFALATGPPAGPARAGEFDHSYALYAVALRHVRPPLVDYAALKTDRATLDRAVAEFASPPAAEEPRWTREQRIAFWINAYNAFTLRAMVDHYPIRSRWFMLQPRNSIRQIDGVWTEIQWRAAGRTVTLDDIEHRILRPTFGEARVHFGVNCASISCPPLAAEPYRPGTLDAQLDAAARAYLASREGVRIDGETLRVSRIFEWYGDDFVARYAALVPGTSAATGRAILGAIVKYGEPDAAELARSGRAHVRFLDYDWSLNDAGR